MVGRNVVIVIVVISSYKLRSTEMQLRMLLLTPISAVFTGSHAMTDDPYEAAAREMFEYLFRSVLRLRHLQVPPWEIQRCTGILKRYVPGYVEAGRLFGSALNNEWLFPYESDIDKCVFCEHERPDHDSDCPWLRAKRARETKRAD